MTELRGWEKFISKDGENYRNTRVGKIYLEGGSEKIDELRESEMFSQMRGKMIELREWENIISKEEENYRITRMGKIYLKGGRK